MDREGGFTISVRSLSIMSVTSVRGRGKGRDTVLNSGSLSKMSVTSVRGRGEGRDTGLIRGP